MKRQNVLESICDVPIGHKCFQFLIDLLWSLCYNFVGKVTMHYEKVMGSVPVGNFKKDVGKAFWGMRLREAFLSLYS